MKKLITICAVVMMMLAVSGLASATIEVPGDYATIQAAINAAAPGDTVLVHAGTYDENLNIDGKTSLKLMGEDKTTTILKSSTTRSWAIPGHPEYNGRMTVIRIYNSSATIENMTIDCDLVKGNNYGITGWDSAVTVNNCILENISAPDLSGYYYELMSYFRAVDFNDESRAAVNITNNTFINAGRVGVVTHDYILATISGNTFYKTIDDFGYAVEMGSMSKGSIIGNTIYGYDTPAASDGSSAAGLYIENSFTNGITTPITKNVLLQGNEIYNCQYAMTVGNEWNGYAGNVDILLTMQGNNFHNNVSGGIIVADEDKEAGSSVTINGSGNTIADNNEFAYFVYTFGDGDITVDLSGDTLTGNQYGMYVGDYPSGPSGSSYSVAINNSKISQNSAYGIDNEVASFIVNAENNWWGYTTGPYHPTSNPAGQGNAVSDNVDFNPWYTSETMSNPVVVYIDNTTDVRAYADTIQAGIDAAYAGDTIVVSAGTYVEDGQIVVDKNLTIKGGSKPTIKPNQDTGTSGDPRGWWLVNAGVELNLRDLILDGSGYNIYQGIRLQGHGTITNVDFNNIDYPPPMYMGTAVAAMGDGVVNVSGCTFNNIGRVGVIYYGSGVNGSVYQHNTYTGKGPGDWLDYGVELGNGAVAEIKNSTITDCNGIASDGSISAGILVSTYFGAGTKATITGNTLTKSTASIGVGIDSDDTSVVVARYNNIAGNIEFGVDNIEDANNSVDATYNWWGDISGPNDPCGTMETDGKTCYDVSVILNADGLGNAVSENVVYCPWLLVPIISSDSPCPAGDLNGDCKVDFKDLAILANNWLVGT